MSVKNAFNIAVCIIGIIILLVHVANLLAKRKRRKDENYLLLFFVFTIIHFATYLTFTLVKIKYTSDTYVMTFYTIFYIFNNVEVFLLFLYMLYFVSLKDKTKKVLSLINVVLFSLFVILDLVNVFTHMFFSSVDGEYTREQFMILAQIYQFVMFAIVFFVSIFNEKLRITEKIAFSLYCFIPLVAIIIQNLLPGYAIAYLAIIISIEILFMFVSMEKSIQLSKEREKNKEAQIKIMMSQIRPHFVYNTLSSISTLIPLDPKKAQKALDEFTEYLRANFSSLTETHLIPFEDELRHIETYVSLEKMRFNDRINIKYDIKCKEFDVPPLSIQPIVENSIKHGILQKLEGGNILIKTYELDNSYVVEISDDGVGFDINNLDYGDNKHIGLANISSRIRTMCSGEMRINSETGKGTTVVVEFYK